MDIMKWTYDDKTVRTAETADGKVLFCGKDVAEALGYTNPRDALAKHCKGVAKCDTLTNGGKQELSFIPESDVYRLAFGSKLPTAERFTDWVTEEVLPAIRRTGSYTAAQTPTGQYLTAIERQNTALHAHLVRLEQRISWLERERQCVDEHEQQYLLDAMRLRSAELLPAGEDLQSLHGVMLQSWLYGAFKERFNVCSPLDLASAEVPAAMDFISTWQPSHKPEEE